MGFAISCLGLSLVAVASGRAVASATPGAFDPTFATSGVLVREASSGATGVAVAPRSGDIATSCCGVTSEFQVDQFSPSGAFLWQAAPFAGAAQAVAVEPSNGDVVAAGYESGTQCGGETEPVVAEYSPSGAFAWSHTLSCISGAEGAKLDGVAIGANGTVIVSGEETVNGIIETLVDYYSSTGSQTLAQPIVDKLGSSNSSGLAVAYSATNGDAYVAGSSYAGTEQELTVSAFTSGGVADSSFGVGGEATLSNNGSLASGVAVLSDGNVVAAGSDGGDQFLLAQFTPTGALDASFGSGGVVTNSPNLGSTVDQFNSLAYQAGGNVLVAAGQMGTGRTEQSVVAEYNGATGALDRSFGSSGYVEKSFATGPSFLSAVATQPNGAVVVAGNGPVVNVVAGEVVMRLLGPAVSVGNLPVLQVTTTGEYSVHFIANLNEPLFSNVSAVFCGGPGESVAGGGTCNDVTFPAGTTAISVLVSFAFTGGIGAQQVETLTVESTNGVSGNPGSSEGSVDVQHISAPPAHPGYWLVASDGGIFAFGGAGFYGSTGGITLNKPIVGMASTPDGKGYWLVASDGGIFAYGDAGFYGSTGGITLNKPIVGMASTPDGKGYWLVASDGGIFNYGDARFFGSTGGITLDKPVVGMAPTPDGKGYWLVGSDGGIFAYGDARFEGSTGGVTLDKPIVDMASYPGAPGYWLVASDGGIFNYGAAGFFGSTGGVTLDKPIVAMTPTYNGQGYWLVASDGGIFNYGNAKFLGSTGGDKLNKPIVGMAALP